MQKAVSRGTTPSKTICRLINTFLICLTGRVLIRLEPRQTIRPDAPILHSILFCLRGGLTDVILRHAIFLNCQQETISQPSSFFWILEFLYRSRSKEPFSITMSNENNEEQKQQGTFSSSANSHISFTDCLRAFSLQYLTLLARV